MVSLAVNANMHMEKVSFEEFQSYQMIDKEEEKEVREETMIEIGEIGKTTIHLLTTILDMDHILPT